MKSNKNQYIRIIFFLSFIIFTSISCTYEGRSFKKISKKEVMESWAWKIFIFTDEGETPLVETPRNNFDDVINEKLIFADDIWKKNLNQDLFLNRYKVAIDDRADNFILNNSKLKQN